MGGSAGTFSGRLAAALEPESESGGDSPAPRHHPSNDDLLFAPRSPAPPTPPPGPPPDPPSPPLPVALEPPAAAGTPPWLSIRDDQPDSTGSDPTLSPSGDDELFERTGPRSFMLNRTLLTVYGRSFGVAPILGLLGRVNSFAEMQQAMQPLMAEIAGVSSGSSITLAPHLLYALARGCNGSDDSCLIYLDASGVDIIQEYIEPAQELGMAVILDAQIGRASPLYIIRRMIDAGFLAYPHVHVALDPEFATGKGQFLPGDPIGQLPADAINQAQALLSSYVRDDNLPVKKVLIVHQFVDALTNSWSMVPNKELVERFPGVDVIFNADGFGTPDAKVWKYNAITNLQAYPQLVWRGIKLFRSNTRAPRFADTPMMTARQLFGLDPTPGGRFMWAAPHLIVVA